MLWPMSNRKQDRDVVFAEVHSLRPFDSFPVKVVGKFAQDALSMKTGWRVLAVFESSIYIQNPAGRLLCIGPMRFGPGPLNALCALPEPIDWISHGLRPDSTVTHNGRSLTVDARFRFSFIHSEVWEPSVLSVPWVPEALHQGLTIIRDGSKRRYQPDGLAPLIPSILDKPEASEEVGSPFLCTARKPVESLFYWLKRAISRRGDYPAEGIRGDLEHLIGLGPGLTPSGDDLMGGVLIALHALGLRGIAETLAELILPEARHRTPVISFEHLKCAAEGQGNTALHGILSAINEQRPDRLIRWLGIIDTVGHTSGWDAVTGLVLVLEAFVDSIGDSLSHHRRPRIAVEESVWV